MQNTQPIGIFDSGIGGLSVLKEIQKLLPNEDLIYIADSAHAPYGNKPHDFILQRCDELTRLLIEQHAKAVVIACNTATAVSVTKLRERYGLPIIAMEPGVKPAIQATRVNIVGVMATQNTLASEQFTRLLHHHAENVEVICQPCPGLVEQIESGEFDSDKTRCLVEEFTRPLLAAGADTIVLGCTHYPLIKTLIREVVGGQINIIETGPAVAQQLQRQLEASSLLSDSAGTGTIQLWTSGSVEPTEKLIVKILHQDLTVTALAATLLSQA